MKTLKKSGNVLKYLLWFGPFLTVAGATARIIAGEWSPVSLALLIAGLVIIGLWLLFLGTLAPGFWGRRSTQAGTNALVATLAMLVLLGGINVLGARYSWRTDLTANQLNTLSPLSQEVVANLEQPLKVWVFTPLPNPADRELLEKYRRHGSNFAFEFVDPQAQPTQARRFDVQPPGGAYIEYGDERQLVQALAQGESLSEVSLTNAIERLTSDRTPSAYFLQGHGERSLEVGEGGGLSQAVTALEERNYIIQPLNLVSRSAVPEDASAVVIAGPRQALLEQEVAALQDYLEQGGSLLLMVDPETNPGLDPILADWGVELDDRIAIDATGLGQASGFGPETSLVFNYGNHPITRDFGDRFSIYPFARPIQTTPVEGVEQTPLLLTSEQSWAESTPEAQPLEFNEEEGDRPGPLTLGVALRREVEAEPEDSPEEPSPSPEESPADSPEASPSPSPEAQEDAAEDDEEDEATKEARLVVLGSSNFAIDGLFEEQLNGDVFLNSLSWLSQEGEQTLSIRPKEQENRRLNLTPTQAGALGWTSLVILPLLAFITAGIVWWQRR